MLAAVSGLDGSGVNTLYSVTKIYLSKNVISPGFRLLWIIIRILRDAVQNPYRWVHIVSIVLPHYS